MGHGGDVIAELTTDHREVEELFGKIEALPSGDEQRKKYADQAVIELVRHSIAEEAYLYPAVREFLPNGDGIADKELEDHAEAERTMKDLEGVDAGDPEFDRLIGELMAEIRSHVRDEEDNLFAQLRSAASEDELMKLGDKVRQAKKTAPTRPHPSRAGHAAGQQAAGPGRGHGRPDQGRAHGPWARTDPPRRRAVSRPRVGPHLRRHGSGRRRNAVMGLVQFRRRPGAVRRTRAVPSGGQRQARPDGTWPGPTPRGARPPADRPPPAAVGAYRYTLVTQWRADHGPGRSAPACREAPAGGDRRGSSRARPALPCRRGGASSDAGTRAAYSTDGSNYRQVPIGVVVPRTVEAAREAVAVCRDHGAPLLSRGGGTSLAGECCNTAVVLDWTKYCNRLVSVDVENRRCVVEPGIVLDELNRQLAEHGLMYGPKPATHPNCTIGGMIGNNSCGSTAQAYGKVVDNLHRLEVLTYDGVRMWVGRTDDGDCAG
ncbi:hypothetical protein SALBM217S_01086 [Streptomyces griseoloalbus]